MHRILTQKGGRIQFNRCGSLRSSFSFFRLGPQTVKGQATSNPPTFYVALNQTRVECSRVWETKLYLHVTAVRESCKRSYESPLYNAGRSIIEAISTWLSTQDTRVPSHVTLCEACSGGIGTGTNFPVVIVWVLPSLSRFRHALYSSVALTRQHIITFSLLITIPLLLYTHL